MTTLLARSFAKTTSLLAARHPVRTSTTTTTTTRLASVLVVSDPLADDGSLPVATQSAVTAALQWLDKTGDATQDVILLTTGGSAAPTAVPTGVTQHVHATTDSKVVETAANAIQQAAADCSPNCIMGTATKWGSSVVPRAAALLQTSPLSDVVDIVDKGKGETKIIIQETIILESLSCKHTDHALSSSFFKSSLETFVRPLYAGNALAKVQAKNTTCPVMTIRPTAFDKAPLSDQPAASTSTFAATDFDKSTWKSQSVSSSASGRPDLTAARIVISGGRGIGSAEQFSVLEDLADAFPAGQAAVGASRAAVDAGMAPNDKQVGQTGKVVAPDLYIAAGISGAIQHISGMKDSKVIVAINKDGEAPIFQGKRRTCARAHCLYSKNHLYVGLTIRFFSLFQLLTMDWSRTCLWPCPK